MRNRPFYGLGLLIVLFYGWLAYAGASSDPYTTNPAQSKSVVNYLQKETPASTTNHLVPRNQVLLEITTGTW